MKTARFLALGGVLAAALGQGLGAQAPAQQPTFRAGVDLISIDVVVVDDDGRQVPGLRADDFSVEVDGKPREVASAQYFEGAAPLVPGATAAGGTTAPAAGEDAASNLIVFAVDTGATTPERRTQVLEMATSLLDRLPPGDRVAVATVPWSGEGITFTSNRAIARGMLESIGGWSPRLGRNAPFSIIEALASERNEPEWLRAVGRTCDRGDDFARDACRASLESEARALVAEVLARANASASGLEGLLRVLANVDGPKTMLFFSEELQTDGARVEVSRVARAAAAARTRIHVMQPQSSADDAGGMFVRYDRNRERQRQVEGLEYISDWTGGDLFALGTSEEIAARLARELSGRYVLLIDTQTGDRDGKPHRIAVTVNGRSVTVRARREFVADNVRPVTTAPPATASAPEPAPSPAPSPAASAATPPAAPAAETRPARRRGATVVGIDPLHPDRGSQETVDIVRALATALGARGFAGAPSPDAAVIRVELTGQRLMNGGMTALPNQMRTGAPPTLLIRVSVTAGDRVTEIRGRNQGEREIVKSAAEETARLIERWLDQGETPEAPARGASAPRAAGDVPPQELLPHVRDYVAGYEQALAGIVAEEAYEQHYSQRISPYPAPAQVSVRESHSEMGFAWFPEPGTWFGFRDVLEVDGKPVPDRQQRLESLFVNRQFPSDEQLVRVAAASARFNLGPAQRNFNVPTMALLVASPANAGRFAFELRGYQVVDGRRLALIAFSETGSPTIITRQGNDWPSRGLLWVEPATGRIWRTDLQLTARDIEMRHTTWFTFDDRLALMVPSRMREVYDYPERSDEYVETVADYSNFRQFQVNTAGPKD